MVHECSIFVYNKSYLYIDDNQEEDDDISVKFEGSSSSPAEGTPTDNGHDNEHSGRIIANAVYI